MGREPENLVLQTLRNIRRDIAGVDEKVDSLRADVASDFVAVNARIDTAIGVLRREMGEQIAGLRRAVVEYHSAVLGHGVLISDLEAGVRRMEQHLGLPSMDAE